MQTNLDIYDAGGTLLLTTPINEGCKWYFTLMEKDYITVKFSLAEALHFGIGCYTEWNGEVYTVVETQDPTYNTSTGGYDYELTLMHDYWLWSNRIIKFTPEYGGREASWSWCGPLCQWCAVFLRNLQTYGFRYKGADYVFSYPENMKDLSKVVSFDNTNLIDALSSVAEAYEIEWWVDGGTIHLGTCQNETKEAVAFKVGENVEKITRTDSQSDYANLIYVFGGTNNIPARYRKKLVFDVKTADGNIISDTARVLDKSYFESQYVTDSDITVCPETALTGIQEVLATKSSPPKEFSDDMGDFEWMSDDSDMGYYLEARTSVWLYKNAETFEPGEYKIDLSSVELGYLMENACDHIEVNLVETATFKSTTLYKASGAYATYQTLKLGILSYEVNTATGFKLELLCTRAIENLKFYKDSFVAYLTGYYSITRTYVPATIKLSLVFVKDPDTEVAATLNPDRTEEGKNEIVLPSGTDASVGDYFTITNINEPKVPVSYFTNDIEESMTVNGVVQSRLMLPVTWKDGKNSIDTVDIGEAESLSSREVVEAVVVNEDIYPRFTSTENGETVNGRAITAVGSRQGKVENETTVEKETVTYWAIQDSGFEFKKLYQLEDATLYITFQSGLLNGMTFEALFTETSDTYGAGQWFEIKRSDDYSRYLPDEYMYPAVGDRYVLTGWDASYIGDTLVDAAEAELLEWGKEYLKKLQVDPSTYTCSMMSDCAYGKNPSTGSPDTSYSYENAISLGDRVELFSKAFFKSGSRVSRIIGWEKNLDILYDSPQYTVGEKASYSKLGDLSNQVDTLVLNGSAFEGVGNSVGGTSVYIITTGDKTSPTDRNVLSALRSIQSFLRKDVDDIAQGLVTFMQGLVLGESGYGLTADGGGNLNILSLVEAVVSRLSTPDFTSGDFGTGAGLYKDGSDWVLELDRLLVRKIATFMELEIRKLSYTAGNVVIGAAGSRLSSVSEVTDADGNITGWKCYWVSDDGTTATTNTWKVNDQARCQDFNIADGVYTGVSNKYYWRLVTEVGDGYIVLSASVKDSGTDNSVTACVPAAGDTITLMGHQTLRDVTEADPLGEAEKDRTNLILLSTTATDSQSVPSIIGYKAITDFDLASAHKVFTLSPKEIVFHSSVFTWDNTEAEWPQPRYRGEWASSAEYAYGDEVTHGGELWICVNTDGSTEEPSANSTDWQLLVSKGQDGADGKDGADGASGEKQTTLRLVADGATTFKNGVGSVTISAHVYYGDDDVTDSYDASLFVWEVDGTALSGEPSKSRTFTASGITDGVDHIRCYISGGASGEGGTAEPTFLVTASGDLLADGDGNLLTA